MVHLFDEGGEKRDKFKTKAADGNTTGAYLIRGLAFSPDSAKLAVAQSDNIVFVYRSARATLTMQLWALTPSVMQLQNFRNIV